MMKQHNNGISEEHIVAYLDGEFNANGEMREALGDGEIHRVAKEYHTLKQVIAQSAADPRFLLSKAADTRARAYLHNLLRANRPEVPMAPDADAVRLAPQVASRTKKFWIKRSAVGFALALFLGMLWFATRPTDTVTTEPVVATNQSQPQPEVVTPPAVTQVPEVMAPEVKNIETPAVAEAPARAVNKPAVKRSAPAPTNIAAAPVEKKPENIVATQPEADPADVMISRRYAKLIKNVRIVEVTQQDKM